MVPLITLSILVYCLACLRPDRDSTFRLLTVTSSFIRGSFGGLPIAPFLNKFGKEMLIFLSLFLLNLSYVVQLFIHVTPFVPSPDNKLTPEILTFTWAQGVGLRLSLVKESKWWNRRSEKSFNWRTTFDPPSSISAKLKNERKILRTVKQEKCVFFFFFGKMKMHFSKMIRLMSSFIWDCIWVLYFPTLSDPYHQY